MGGESARLRPLIAITLDVEDEYLKLKRHYPAVVMKAGGMPLLVPYANDPLYVAGSVDGLLIPGGDDIDPSYYAGSVSLPVGITGATESSPEGPKYEIVPRERTDFEIALLEAIMELRKPVLGICYGMQLINVALGGGLYQDLVPEFGGAIDHRKGNHRILGTGGLTEGVFTVNSSHHQGVRRLGRGLLSIAGSEDGLVEAIQLKDYPFLVGVQWHPERGSDELSARILNSFVETCHVR